MINFVLFRGKECFWLKTFLIVFFIVSCNRDFEVEEGKPQLPSKEESYGKVVTINLWGSEATVLDVGDSYIFQGDIVIKKKDLFIYEQDSLKLRSSASAVRVDRKWPDNQVYYTLSNVSAANKKIFYEAIAEIEEKTYLNFHQRYRENDYIEVKYHHTDKWIAYSDFIGRKGGRQEINLSKGAWTKGIIIHEICHALGLYHEQCRADRDNYINILFENLTEEEKYQYATYIERGNNGVDIGDFDFNSVMLYSSYFDRYNENGDFLGTILGMTKKDGSVFYNQRFYLSDGDARGLITNHPPIRFTFEKSPPDPIFLPYKHEKNHFLKCPEDTKIKFKLSKLFKINYDNFNPPNPKHLGGGLEYYMPPIDFSSLHESFSLDDYDIKAIISIEKKGTTSPLYRKEFSFDEEIFTWEDEFIDIDIPKGFYSVKLTLTGSVKGTTDTHKENNLQKLLNSPSIFFSIEEVKVENQNIFVPKNFGNPHRLDTFIKL